MQLYNRLERIVVVFADGRWGDGDPHIRKPFIAQQFPDDAVCRLDSRLVAVQAQTDMLNPRVSFEKADNVFVGKVDEKEVDFIAEKASHKMYIQVCETLGDSKTLERELALLLAIQNNYEKFIITNDRTFVESYEGIKVKNTADWLCE